MEEYMMRLPEEYKDNKKMQEYVELFNKLICGAYSSGFEAGKKAKENE